MRLKAAAAAVSACALVSACREMLKVVAMSGAEKSKRSRACVLRAQRRRETRMTDRSMGKDGGRTMKREL